MRTAPILLILLSGCFSSAPAGAPPTPPTRLAPARQPWVGTASCAAGPCHGQRGPQGSLGSEYDTWISADPHSRAFDVLREPRSEAMCRGLGLREPTAERLCLSCHLHPGASAPAEGGGLVGVGCESCHGPAGTWIDRHYRPGWDRQGPAEIKSLADRAALCARCHVGAPGMEVNHDLIALGHPPLQFEFAAYHANLPAHWDERKERRACPDLEARAWLVGQLETARAALTLLAGRADASDAVWPELAEFRCSSCHHDLRAVADKRPQRVIAWQGWNLALVPRLVAAPLSDLWAQDVRTRQLRTQLAAVRFAMEGPRALTPLPVFSRTRLELAEQARTSAALLHDMALQVQTQPVEIARLAEAVLSDPESDWDSAGQRSLAHAALRQAWSDVSGAAPFPPRLALPPPALRKAR